MDQEWYFNGLTGNVDVSNVDIDWSYVDLSPGARVARGMLYVQRTYPDALSKVDIDTLDIADGEHCVLGQIHGHYGLAPEFDTTDHAWREAHGFLLMSGDEFTDDGFAWHLNVLWRTAFQSWRDAS